MITFYNSHGSSNSPNSPSDTLQFKGEFKIPNSITFLPSTSEPLTEDFTASSSIEDIYEPQPTNSDYNHGTTPESTSSENEDFEDDYLMPTQDTHQVEKSPYESILSFRESSDGSYEYFVKMRNRPYRECQWIPESEYLKYPNAMQSLKRYHKKNPVPPSEPYYNPAFDEPEKIIACNPEGYFVEDEPHPLYLVKWCSLDYEECTWESDIDETLIEQYNRQNIPNPNLNKPYIRPEYDKDMKIEPLEYKGGRKLFNYQQDGLNWLFYSWLNGRNCILADEMGLGKTIQAVAFIDYLYNEMKMPGPFLVIAPLSTLPHWQRSFQDWTDLNAVVYSGSKTSREIIRDYEFNFPDGSGPKFDVLIVQYENIMNDNQIFAAYKYNVLIVDEAHRLKNAHSKLLQALASIHSESRILLTGTPLQNTIEELQSLLEFLHPGRFTDLNNSTTTKEGIEDLRRKLKPHLLRRLKVDVDQTIARKEETIIECSLTKTQKQFYRAILEMNAGFLSKSTNLQNISMELRKCCLHPYLIKGAEDKIVGEKGGYGVMTNQEALDCLIKSSGKFILLNKLLPKLQADGHRVLVFSQMTQLLDILGDFLNGIGYKFLRIDGGVPGRERQRLIDQFNAEGSEYFIFLLCTRAGGLGINLNAADTVIIFDSDWNPQNDLQAQARCHRIGQNKVVKVYRLLMKGTYEEHMFEAASKKLGLGQAVLDRQKNQEIDKLLRKGAYHMLNDIEEENFGEEDIDQILSNRSKVVVYNEAAGSSFSKATFDYNNEEKTDIDIEDPNFWSKILPQQQQDPNENDEQDLDNDDGHMRTRRRYQTTDDDLVDDDVSKEWRRSERERLQHLLSWYGWDRWDDAQRLSGLKRPVLQIKLGARAFLRWLLYNFRETDHFPTAEMLLHKAMSTDFDPNFVNNDDAEAVDSDFMKQSAFLDPEFIQVMQKKGGAWIKRIETLYYITMGVEKANRVLSDIIVPKTQGNILYDWWDLIDDRCLIYGTWKWGFARYEEILQDPEIPFSYKALPDAEPPQSPYLTPRLKKLANGIRKFYSEGNNLDDLPTEIIRTKPSLWKKKEKSIILQRMLHEGVPVTSAGELDWTLFREELDLLDKTDEQIEKIVFDMMNPLKENGDGEIKPENRSDEAEKEEHEPPESTVNHKKSKSKSADDDKDDEKESGKPLITAERIRQRFMSLNKLRQIFVKHNEEDLKEYFNFLPRWRNVPRAWTNQVEYVFFKEINIRGWGVCGEILKLPDFDGVFDGEPPNFITNDMRVMRRLEQVMKFIETNTLEGLREAEAKRPKKKAVEPKPDLAPTPDIQYNEDGTPVMPINLTATAYITDLGHIVTDRPAFHTERYIYPAGFKSSRMYASTIDPGKKVRYTCEIIDTGDPVPLFRVTMDEQPQIKYEGNSPTSPWNLILKRIFELRAETATNPRALSISGPEYYGLAHPTTIYLIQQMPECKQCTNYIEKQFAPPVPKAAVTKPTPQPRRRQQQQQQQQQASASTSNQSSQINPPLSPQSSNSIDDLHNQQQQQQQQQQVFVSPQSSGQTLQQVQTLLQNKVTQNQQIQMKNFSPLMQFYSFPQKFAMNLGQQIGPLTNQQNQTNPANQDQTQPNASQTHPTTSQTQPNASQTQPTTSQTNS